MRQILPPEPGGVHTITGGRLRDHVNAWSLRGASPELTFRWDERHRCCANTELVPARNELLIRHEPTSAVPQFGQARSSYRGLDA